MDTPRMRIIVVEDEIAHAQAISRSFNVAGNDAEILVAATLAEYRQMVAANNPDIVLMDLRLPDGNAIDELIAPSEAGPFPILIMTSHGNEQVAVETIKRGALDYVVKSADAFAEMPRIVARALREWNLLKERQRMADALRKLLDRPGRKLATQRELV